MTQKNTPEDDERRDLERRALERILYARPSDNDHDHRTEALRRLRGLEQMGHVT